MCESEAMRQNHTPSFSDLDMRECAAMAICPIAVEATDTDATLKAARQGSRSESPVMKFWPWDWPWDRETTVEKKAETIVEKKAETIVEKQEEKHETTIAVDNEFS